MILDRYLKKVRIYLMKRYGAPARHVQGVALYAQGLEDMYLLRLFGRDYRGFYVDVGANDGIFVSNTYALYRQGWRGVCIDPNPVAYAALTRHRPDDACVNVAIGRNPGTVELAWQGNITEGSAVRSGQQPGQRCQVELKPLTDVLREHGAPAEFDLLSIDVEGMEHEVLLGLDWAVYKPHLVILEYNSEGEVNTEAFDLLLQQGYRPILINRWNILLSRHWARDMLRVHRGQDWFRLDRMVF